MVDAPAFRKSRTITSAGMEQFEEKVNRHVFKLGNIKRDIDSIFMDIAENPVMNFERTKMCKISLTKFMMQYEKASGEYAAYLQSQRHERGNLTVTHCERASRKSVSSAETVELCTTSTEDEIAYVRTQPWISIFTSYICGTQQKLRKPAQSLNMLRKKQS